MSLLEKSTYALRATARSSVSLITPSQLRFAQSRCSEAKANGGAIEIRTRDLLHAMQARYQLRYSPTR